VFDKSKQQGNKGKPQQQQQNKEKSFIQEEKKSVIVDEDDDDEEDEFSQVRRTNSKAESESKSVKGDDKLKVSNLIHGGFIECGIEFAKSTKRKESKDSENEGKVCWSRWGRERIKIETYRSIIISYIMILIVCEKAKNIKELREESSE